MGVVVAISELSIGVESSSPEKNDSMLMQAPKTAAKKMRLKSSRSIVSLGAKMAASQKKTNPPITRIKIKANGLTRSGITPLATV